MDTRKVILVAEDQLMLGKLIHTLLREDGYEVLAAADGYEALELSRTHQGFIDLFLTDVDMPRIDGVSAFRQISAERAGMKVLFMSGSRLEPSLREAWPLVSKPFGLATLLSKVNEVLHEPSVRESDTGQPGLARSA